MQSIHRPMLGLGFRLASAIAVAAMFALSKVVGEHGVSLAETMFWRQAVTVPILATLMALGGKLGRLKTRRLGGHMVRATLGTVGMTVTFAAVRVLHISEATTLGFTVPLFAVVITALFMPEKVGVWRWLAVIVGFAGVVLITRPGNSHVPLLGLTLGLAGAACGAVISFQIRELARTEAPTTVVFWFGVFGALFAAPLLPFFYVPHDTTTWIMLIGVGAVGTASQWLLTSSLRYGSVASVVVMDYTQIVWATLLGWLVWNELPAAQMWLGVPLIVASGLIIAWSGRNPPVVTDEAL